MLPKVFHRENYGVRMLGFLLLTTSSFSSFRVCQNYRNGVAKQIQVAHPPSPLKDEIKIKIGNLRIATELWRTMFDTFPFTETP